MSERGRARDIWLAVGTGAPILLFAILWEGLLGAQALAAVTLVSALSLLGALSFSVERGVLWPILDVGVALGVGMLLGDSLLHLIPDAVNAKLPPAQVGGGVAGGFAVFLVLQMVLHKASEASIARGGLALTASGAHNFVDGVLIGLAFISGSAAGWATTAAIAFHEVPHELANFAILLDAGYSRHRALFLNLLASLTAIAGAIVAWTVGRELKSIAIVSMPWIGGAFLYLALAVLAPHLWKHHPGRGLQLSTIGTLGFLLMWALTILR